MQTELGAAAQQLRSDIAEALLRIDFDRLSAQYNALHERAQKPDFWDNPRRAQEDLKSQSKLEGRITPWQNLRDAVNDLVEIIALGDNSMDQELKAQLDQLSQQFDVLKDELNLAGHYDDYNAVLSIYAGAGGTDAQDWAQMLRRMYTRWAERNNLTTTLVNESTGDEAGIKSATLEISGSFVYGKLKGEHGVHRLVRLSPFNADNLRQTSFAKVEVSPLIDRSEELAVDEKELRIDVYRSGGHGGQSVNTTDSAVRVTHIPTGIVVVIQNERSQLQNKETALTILRSKLIQLQMEQRKEHIEDLKGPNQSAEWGSQIRSYVLHPYKQVKDLRTHYETNDAEGVLDGALDPFIEAYLDYSIGQSENL
jgi:peptide chain release factor 2